MKREQRRQMSKNYIYGVIFLIILVIAILAVCNNFSSTGNAIFSIKQDYIVGENLEGVVKLSMKAGELIPVNSILRVSLGNYSNDYIFRDLINEQSLNGKFYAEGIALSDSGEGFGVAGKKITYPEVDFKLAVTCSGFDETPVVENNPEGNINENVEEAFNTEFPVVPVLEETLANEVPTVPVIEETSVVETPIVSETSSENIPSPPVVEGSAAPEASVEESVNLISGNVIAPTGFKVDGKASKEKDFEYNLDSGCVAEIIEGSASVADAVLGLSVVDGKVIIKTNYEKEESGFGEDYLGDIAKTIALDLNILNLSVSDNLLSIELVYEGIDFAKIEKQIYVHENAPLENETVIDKAVNDSLSNLSFVGEIPTIRIKSGENYSLDLGKYFVGAESYELSLNNFSVVFENNILTLIPEEDFRGVRRANIVAYGSVGQVESNDFNVMVSSGNINVKTERGQIKVGEKVKWTQNISLDVPEQITVQLPASAENISVSDIENSDVKTSGLLTGNVVISLEQKEPTLIEKISGKISDFFKNLMTGKVVSEIDVSSSADSQYFVELVIDQNSTEYSIEYYTEAPVSFENETSYGKQVVISAADELNYTDVLSFTNISEIYNIGEEGNISVYWVEENQYVPFDAYDMDGNGKLDYIEWITPHLSDQSFDISYGTYPLNLTVSCDAECPLDPDPSGSYMFSGYHGGYPMYNRSDSEFNIWATAINYVLTNSSDFVTSATYNSWMDDFNDFNVTGIYTAAPGRTGNVSVSVVVPDTYYIIYDCTNIIFPGTYTLNQSITTTENCFNIAADNVIIDGNGFTISGDSVGSDWGIIVDSGLSGVSIKNMTIEGFGDLSLVGGGSISFGRMELTSGPSFSTISDINIINSNYFGIFVFGNNNNLSRISVSYGVEAGINLFGSNNILEDSSVHGVAGFPGLFYGGIVTEQNNIIRNVDVSNSDIGLSVLGSGNQIENVVANSNSVNGIYLYSANSNVLDNVTANSNSEEGIYIESSKYNNLSNIIANENERGISLYNSTNNVLTNIITSNNLNFGIDVSSTIDGVTIGENSGNIFSDVVSEQNGRDGVSDIMGIGNVFSNITVNSNGYVGLHLYYSSNNNLSDISANLNNWTGIYLESSLNNNLGGVSGGNLDDDVWCLNSSVNTNNGLIFTTQRGCDSWLMHGSGTAGDPYQIDSWAALNATRNNLTAYYILTANLSSETAGYVGLGDSWVPIGGCGPTDGECFLGDLSYSFSGNFDGQNNTISDISRSGENMVGFFGFITGNVSNIGLINVSFSSYGDIVGGLVGYQVGGTISNSYITGEVRGHYWTGGLVGYQVGGTISNSYSTGIAYSNGDWTGGLVGQSSGIISNSYSTGYVQGNGDYVGGLVGQSSGTISNSYSIGDVDVGSDYVGGLVGYQASGTISNSYSIGIVYNGDVNYGGLVGLSSGTITNSYYNSETSGQSDNDGRGVPKTTVQMKNIFTYDVGGWNISSNVTDVNSYPYLAWQAANNDYVWMINQAPSFDIVDCGYLNSAGEYNLLNDISAGEGNDCLIIRADDVTINGNGFTVTGNVNATNNSINDYYGDGTLMNGYGAYGGLILNNITIIGNVSLIGGNGAAPLGGSGNGGSVTLNNSNVSFINSYGGIAYGDTVGSGGAVTLISSNVSGINSYGGIDSQDFMGYNSAGGGNGGLVVANFSIISGNINTFGRGNMVFIGGGGNVYLFNSSAQNISANAPFADNKGIPSYAELINSNASFVDVSDMGASFGSCDAGLVTLRNSNVENILSFGGYSGGEVLGGCSGGEVNLLDGSSATLIDVHGGGGSGDGGSGGIITLNYSILNSGWAINVSGGIGLEVNGTDGEVNYLLYDCSSDLSYGSPVRYDLQNNITGDCNVRGDNVTIDGNGFTITGNVNAARLENQYCTALNSDSCSEPGFIIVGFNLSTGNGFDAFTNLVLNNLIIDGNVYALGSSSQTVSDGYTLIGGNGGNGGFVNISFSNINEIYTSGGPGGVGDESLDSGGASGQIAMSNSIVGNIIANGGAGWGYGGSSGNSSPIGIFNSSVGSVSASSSSENNCNGGNGAAINITLSNITGNINANGGENILSPLSLSSYCNPGSGLSINMVSSNMGGNISANGGDSIYSNGGNGAIINITSSNISGSINVSGGDGGIGGSGGAIMIVNSNITAIISDDGDYGNGPAISRGGDVVIGGSRIMSVSAQGGDGINGGDSSAGGNVRIINSIIENVTTAAGNWMVGSGNSGKNGGAVNVINSTIAFINTTGGSGAYGSASGNAGAINISLSNITGDIVANGGIGEIGGSYPASGNGATIDISSSNITGKIDAYGGDSFASSGGNGAGINITSSNVTGSINNYGGSSNEGLAGNGGIININSSNISGNINAYGGNSEYATAGSGAIININSSNISGNINAYGGNSFAISGGNSAAINIISSNMLGDINAYGGISFGGNGGNGAAITATSSNVTSIAAYGGAGGTASGYGGVVTLIYSRVNLSGGINIGDGYSSDESTRNILFRQSVLFNEFGELKYLTNFSTRYSVLPLGMVQIGNDFAYVNSDVTPATSLNSSANVTLNLSSFEFVNPQILKDGVLCVAPGCNILSHNRTSEIIKFNVSSWSNYTISETTFAAGSGTAGDPYQIDSWYSLNAVRNNLSAYYILTANLSSATQYYSGIGNSWVPIGNSTIGYEFSGNFNGQNNTISNLKINLPSTFNVGLFGGSSGDISNLGLINVNISGSDVVGGLVGYQTGGTVSNSYSTGNVTGVGVGTGGLVGYQVSGAVSNCYSGVKVSGGSMITGGLIGYSAGTVSNSYSTGNVTGTNYVGGFVGWQAGGGTITNSYAIGKVVGSSYTGGLVGSSSGTITNSYYDSETSGQSDNDGRGEPKTTAQMKNILTFGSWNITQGLTNINNEYPYLAWQANNNSSVWMIYQVPLNVTSARLASSGIKNYTNENLSCYANATSGYGKEIIYSGDWYRNGTVFVQSSYRTLGKIGSGAYGIDVDDFGNQYIVDGYSISKYNSSDNQVWNKSTSGWVSDVAVDVFGNVFVGGYIERLAPDYNTELIISKYDFNGNVLWEKSVGDGSAVLESSDVAVDVFGNIYIVGTFYNNVDYLSNIWVVKYDSEGNQIWKKSLNESRIGIGEGIDVDDFGNVYVDGTTDAFGAGNNDIWTIKYNSSGSQIWNKTFGGSSQDEAKDIAVDSLGNVYSAGRTYSFGAGNWDFVLIKYNSSGDQIWNKTAGGAGNDYGEGVAVDDYGNIYFTGYTLSFGAGREDIWTIKYNSSGSQIWNKTNGGSGSDYGYAVAVNGNGSVYVAGRHLTPDYYVSDEAMIKFEGFLKSGQIGNNEALVGSLDSQFTEPGENWTCKVSAFDGTNYSSQLASNQLRILDSVCGNAWEGTPSTVCLVDSCGRISVSGSYVLQNNVTSVGNCFNITTSNVTLDGNRYYATGNYLTGTGGIYSSTSGLRNISIKNISLQGFNQDISLDNVNDSLIENVRVQDSLPVGYFSDGIRLDNSSNNIIRNNYINITANIASANFWERNSNNNLISGNVFASSGNSQDGVQSHYSSNVTFYNNSFIGLHRAMILAGNSGTAKSYLQNDNIVENSLDNCSYGILLWRNTSGNTLLNNNFTNIANFSIETSWYDSFANLSTSGVNYLVYNNSYGQVKFSDNNFSHFMTFNKSLVFGSDIIIGQNIVNVSSALLGSSANISFTYSNYTTVITSTVVKVNSSANVTFYDSAGYTGQYPARLRKILNSGSVCTFCNNLTALTAPTIVFNVSSFGSGNISIAKKVNNSYNVTLNSGWNMISLTMQGNYSGDKNVSLSPGWNLVGYSSASEVSPAAMEFTNTTGSTTSWNSAAVAGKVQKYVSYYDSNASKNKYLTVGKANLNQGGYWVYAEEAGNLTLPSAGGNSLNETYALSDITFSNGTEEKNISAAVTAGWILSNDLYYWTDYNTCIDLGFYPNCYLSVRGYDSGLLNSWRGYFMMASQNNITMLRQD